MKAGILSIRQICDEVRARELERDFNAGLLTVHETKITPDALIIKMTDYVVTSETKPGHWAHSPVKIQLDCTQLTSQRLQKHFATAGVTEIDHAHQIIPTFYLVAPVCEDSHEPRYHAV